MGGWRRGRDGKIETHKNVNSELKFTTPPPTEHSPRAGSKKSTSETPPRAKFSHFDSLRDQNMTEKSQFIETRTPSNTQFEVFPIVCRV